jgi:thiamine biosynthesis lipoprotein
MKQTRILMGMPVSVEVLDPAATDDTINEVFAYFEYVDEKFSTYKETSEISQINNGQITLAQASADMQTIFALADQTKQATNGFFDIAHDGRYDPSGIVKGWAIDQAAEQLHQKGFKNFYVDAGGDIQAFGRNEQHEEWRVGIRNPFNLTEIVKVLAISNCGVATSGNYVRGHHIYNPMKVDDPLAEVVSLTVVGPNIYEADRFATAAFAMGRAGIVFIESLDNFEGYMIDAEGQATLTSGLGRYTL